MMNSTVEDEDFPPNPFRSQGGGGGTGDLLSGPMPTQQPVQQQQFAQQPQQFAAAPAPQQQFAPAPVQQQQQFAAAPVQQQQFAAAPVQQQQQFVQPPQQTQQQYGVGGAAVGGNATMGAPAPISNKSWWETCVGCFKMETYQAYFDVDTLDVQNRIISSMLTFHLQDHFRNSVVGAQKTDTLKGPDLYGPLWITMTLVFLTAATSNFAAYMHFDHENSEETFEYNIQHLVSASSILFSFVFVIPTIYWMATNCMGLRALNLVDWICYYGYAMVPYMPAVIICMLPMNFWSWLVLMAATAASALLVIKNVSNALLAVDVTSPATKAPTVIMSILGVHIVFFFTMKFVFFKHD